MSSRTNSPPAAYDDIDTARDTEESNTIPGIPLFTDTEESICSCVERGPIPTAQYKKIQTNYETLLKYIVDPIVVCIKLFSALVFDENDKEIIESEKLRTEQTDKLLRTVTKRGPRAFDELLLALSATGHHQAKEILEQDEGEDVAATNDNRYFIMRIKFPDLQYHSEYSDPNSEKYKELNDKLVTLFKEYGCDTTVTSLSLGSVIVSLVFATSTSTDEDSLLAIFHKVLTSGYLGEYKVSTDNFLFRGIGEWLTNSNTNNTEEVIPVIGDKNTVSLTEQHGDGVIVDCVLSTTSKSELNNFYPILEIILKSGRFDQNQVSADQFSFHQIGGWLNEKPETTTDKQRAVMIDEQATLPGKMKTDKPEPSSRTDTSSASDVSLIRYTEPSVPCTDSTEQAMSRTGSMEVLDNKGFVERGRMPPDQYIKIQGNYQTLLKYIVNPTDVCRELFSAFVFDEDDERRIESEKNRIEQTNKLLMTLMGRGPRAFDSFLLALSATGHHQVRHILEQGWLNKNVEPTDEQGTVMIDEQATLPGKMKTDKPESSSRTDTSSASDVSPIRYKESSVPCTDSTEQATSRTGSTEVLDNKAFEDVIEKAKWEKTENLTTTEEHRSCFFLQSK